MDKMRHGILVGDIDKCEVPVCCNVIQITRKSHVPDVNADKEGETNTVIVECS